MLNLKNNGLSALELAKLGYHVFFLTPNSKIPLKGTNGCKDATRDEATIMQLSEAHPNSNIGIATGKEQGYFVLDIDVGDGKYGEDSFAELERTYEKLPDTVESITQSGGRHLYFKYPQGVEIPCSAGKLGVNLDIRSDNGYCVAAPSTIDGKVYEWEGSSDPTEGVEMADAPQWLINLIKRDAYAVVKQTSSGEYYESSEWECMPNYQQVEYLEALNFLPHEDRDEWVAAGMATHSMDSTQIGFDMWDKASQKSAKYKADDAARVWFSFNNKPNKRNKETVFFMAREKGWKSEAAVQKEIEVDIAGKALAYEMENPIKHDPQEYKKDEPIDYDFPHDVEILNQLRGIIRNATGCNVTAATTQAVIALASTVAARRFLTPSGDSCHLYIGVSSAENSGLGNLRYTSRYIADILHACGMQAMLRENRISSTQVLYKTLYQSPSSLYVCDDYSAMIKLSNKQTTGSMEVVLNTITKIHGVQRIHLDSIYDLGLSKSEINPNDDENRPTIAHPCLTMFSTISYKDLPIFARAAEIGRGSVEQFLIAICNHDDIEIKNDKELDIKEEIIQKLYDVRGWKRKDEKREYTFQDAINAFIDSSNGQIKVVFEGGEESLDQYDKMIDHVIEKDFLSSSSSFRHASRKNLRRLATILAAFNYQNGEYVATKAIIKWCASYVIKHLQKLLDTLSVVSTDDGTMDAEQKVLQFLWEKGAEGIQHNKLVSNCGAYRKLSIEKRKELIDKLTEDKMIKPNVKTKQKSGQFTNCIVHSKFNPYPSTEE